MEINQAMWTKRALIFWFDVHRRTVLQNYCMWNLPGTADASTRSRGRVKLVSRHGFEVSSTEDWKILKVSAMEFSTWEWVDVQ